MKKISICHFSSGDNNFVKLSAYHVVAKCQYDQVVTGRKGMGGKRRGGWGDMRRRGKGGRRSGGRDDKEEERAIVGRKGREDEGRQWEEGWKERSRGGVRRDAGGKRK